MENPTAKNLEATQEFSTRNEVLSLAPGQLAEYLDSLAKQDKLPEYLREAVQDDSLVAS